MDTDSFLLRCIGIDIFDEAPKGPLTNFMVLSNLNINHASYNVAINGELGLFKSETGSIPIK